MRNPVSTADDQRSFPNRPSRVSVGVEMGQRVGAASVRVKQVQLVDRGTNGVGTDEVDDHLGADGRPVVDECLRRPP